MAEVNSRLGPYFRAQVEAVRPRLSWQAKDLAAHRAWRARFRRRLKNLLGNLPRPVPLQVRWDETKKTQAFTRHKVYLRSEAHYWVPAYYFVPNRLDGPRPAVVCLHGHSGILPYIREGTARERELARTHAVDYAPFLAERGYITLALVQRGWNETDAGLRHPPSVNGCYNFTENCFLLGMTPVGLRVWDAMRAVDFLRQQPEVNGRRLGAAGLSGGGTTTLFFAALDPRVKAALIAGYFCTFRDSIYAMHHCICNTVPQMMLWGEMSDVASLIAPRAALMINGLKDTIFPIQAARKAYRALGRVYRLLGQRGNLESDFFPGGHAWSNRKVLPFLKRHLG